MPLKDCLAEVYELLKGAIELDARFQHPIGPKKEVHRGMWGYQVLYNNTFGVFQNIDQNSVQLQRDDDYRKMLERIADVNEHPFHAILMQVGAPQRRDCPSLISAFLIFPYRRSFRRLKCIVKAATKSGAQKRWG